MSKGNERERPELWVSGVYWIVNVITGMFYIGSSSHIWRRWCNHRSMFKYNRHSNPKLQEDWNLYGQENFRIEVLEITRLEDLEIKEQFWMDKKDSLNKGYNCWPLASSPIGYKYGEETKQNMSRSRLELVSSERGKEIVKTSINKRESNEKYQEERLIRLKLVHNDPIAQNNLVLGIRKKYQEKEYQEKMSALIIERHKDPQFRKNIQEGKDRKNKDKEYMARKSEISSKNIKKLLADPEFQKKCQEARRKNREAKNSDKNSIS
jgi:group I intron endonuclease